MEPLPSILIHEYVCGGGWQQPCLPKDLANEGLAMLRALVADFKGWGGCKIITTRDTRLAHVSLEADQIIDLAPDTHYETLSFLAANCTAALIIAPETDGILEKLSRLVERRGACLLGSSPASISLASNKWRCHKLFTDAGLPTPDSWCVTPKKAGKMAQKIGFPLVIKPVDGVGCEGVCLITDPSSTQAALLKNNNSGTPLLLQKYIKGDSASVSLLVTEKEILFLSLNSQIIEIDSSFCYKGGQVPFARERQQEVFSLVKQAVALVPGLKGYIGVDLILTDQGCFLIEINPRITTAYIGLRRVVNINLAAAIWGIFNNRDLPKKISLSGKAVFKKEELI